ncbi:MAG TPA: hypothetical protein VLT62_31260 [Candidatus Methylomirabilis sp.]|nr:hypothetical protein [Candidatus Methylomirabilis sp.]
MLYLPTSLLTGLVPSLARLRDYPWTGHATLMGRRPREWQDTDTILARFGRRPTVARQRYAAFLQDGLARWRRPDLVGGGRIRSAGGGNRGSPTSGS